MNKINKWLIEDKLFNFYCMYYLTDMLLNVRKSPRVQRKIQNRRLRKLVKRAYQIPFYRKRFDEAGIKPEEIRSKEDLAKLPILTKKEYRDWMNEELKKPEVKYFKLTQTSGSTGMPTTNIFPPKEYAKHYMMDLFCWIRGGYNPFIGKTLTCAPGDTTVGMNLFIQKLGILRRECFSMQWEREKIVDKINRYKPDFILGYSAELVYIAQYCLENNISVHKPKFYCAGGEHVEGLPEQILKKVFGDNMINYYGCTEMADFAYRVPRDSGYSVMEDCVAVIVDTENGIKNRGTGSILATPLYRTYYPLINYEVGDKISLIERNGLDYISEIEGRKQDIFYWESGKRTTHKDLWLISRKLKDIYQIRFVQESYEKVTIQVVKDSGSNKSIKDLEQYLTAMFGDAFEEGVTISYQWLDEMPPNPNGKIGNMISKIGEKDGG